MYQTILFDLDGTLTDPKEGITKSAQYALRHFDIEEPDLDSLTKFIGPPLMESFKTFYGFDESQAQLAISKYRERYRQKGMYENGVYEGIEELLIQLKQQGRVLAVATSKPTIFAVPILEKYGIAQYFDVIVGAELDGVRDKKAEVIEEVFRQLGEGIDRSSCVMVGDRRQDVIGAATWNLPCIGVRFGYAEEGELEEAGATCIVEDVASLGKLLLGE